jgi:hypothetical protein
MESSASLTFAFSLRPGIRETWAVMLARSIRECAGRFSDAPILAVVPAAECNAIAPASPKKLEECGVRIEPFDIDSSIRIFPFGTKTLAAGHAESMCERRSSVLVWMDTDSLVLQEPTALLLPNGVDLGYRPVDHTVVGSPIEEPIHPVWQLLYDRLGLDIDRIHPMRASVDERLLRPYFNAGLVVVRPELRLLRSWGEAFKSLLGDPMLADWYEQDRRYAIFVHQMVLACVLLSRVRRERRLELPHLVSFPLHMHRDYPGELRPATIDDLITCRHDEYFESDDWRRDPFIPEKTREWIVRLRA